MTQAKFWQNVKTAKQRTMCATAGSLALDMWFSRLLGEAAEERFPVGAEAWGWKFSDGSVLIMSVQRAIT